MQHERGTVSPAARADTARLTIAMVGGNLRAASILRLLSEIENVYVAAVACAAPSAPAARLAEDLGVFVTPDHTEIFQLRGLDLIVDMSEDPRIHAALHAQKPAGVEIFGSAGSELVWDLLVARKRGEEQEKLFVELQVAYDKIRSHERRLQSSKEALERSNTELESRLAEIFFTHEFFKALTSYSTVDDVCSLIVDGANGILGAEISCVYLYECDEAVFRLRASQGRSERAYRQEVGVSETILGETFRRGLVQEHDVALGASSAAWAIDPADVRSQAAVPLRSGEQVIGVLVVASSTYRELSETELDRLQVIGNQSALSLQNALLHQELERLSVTDRLTELYNHGYFHQRLEAEVERAARFRHPLSLVMLDIDDFKEFNDRYGHPRGDEVLRAVADIVRENLREIDVAARYGGEEFVIVLPETDTQGALSVAERVRRSVEESVFHVAEEPASVRKSISVGIATYPVHAATSTQLVDAADKAMYDAKRDGKNQVRIAQ